ncbi:MAG TPA: hypothetical protein VN823_26290 [Stellaceae bacterium]|nr:hypothetical protein [Stellaceae bacterium]
MKSRISSGTPAGRVAHAALSGTALSALALAAFISGPAAAASITWTAPALSSPADFDTSTNWNPNTVPGSADTAVFGSGAISVNFSTVTNTVGGIQFTGQAFEFNVGATSNPGPVVLNLTGAGVVDQTAATKGFEVGGPHAGTINFSNSAGAGDSSVLYNVLGAGTGLAAGSLVFHDTSNAGGLNPLNVNPSGANISISGADGPGAGGSVAFLDHSTAGDASIAVNIDGAFGGLPGAGATLSFQNSSTAGMAGIDVFEAGNATGTAGVLTFTDTASAGTALITVHGNTTLSTDGGIVLFEGTSTAAFSTINVTGGFLEFTDTATAGNATIVLDGAGMTDVTIFGGIVGLRGSAAVGNSGITAGGGGGTTTAGGIGTFTGSSTAGGADILVQGGVTASSVGGALIFAGNSSAGTSMIGITGGSLGGDDGQVNFGGSASAANATIFNGGTCAATPGKACSTTFDSGGTVTFTGGSTAGHATIDNAKLVQFLGGADGGQATYLGYAGSTLSISGVSNAGGTLANGTSVVNTLNIGSIGGNGPWRSAATICLRAAATRAPPSSAPSRGPVVWPKSGPAHGRSTAASPAAPSIWSMWARASWRSATSRIPASACRSPISRWTRVPPSPSRAARARARRRSMSSRQRRAS